MGKESMTEAEIDALERLIEVARRGTGQSVKASNFLLAWWNAEACGGFDLADVWGVDRAIASDMLTVFAMLTRLSSYPDSLGFREDFEEIVRQWRPEPTTTH